MNRGLLIKALREVWPVTALLGGAMLLFEAILAYVLPTFAQQFSAQWLQMKFAQSIIKAMVGAEVVGEVGPDLFTSIPWVHPVVLALTWAHAIVVCTRVPVGEVDRGTVDVLLGLPISRWELFRSETLVWLCAGVVMLLAGLLGNAIGSAFVSAGIHAPMQRILLALVNLGCLYFCVGGAAWMLSSLSDRRGKAIAVAFIIVLASFLLNYIAQLWEPARRLEFLSILHYYRPLLIIRDGAWPVRDMLILIGLGLALWISAGITFARRDLSTV